MSTWQLALIQYSIIIYSTHAFSNEICFPHNWIAAGRNLSWSFNDTRCTLTNDINRHNLAILHYKTWSYLSNEQDTSYKLEIEYNFTILEASANNTIGSIGVIFYPNSAVYNYIAVSFKQNEALVAYGSNTQKFFHYENVDRSNDGPNDTIVLTNYGALPFTLAIDTFYSMRVQIYNIIQNRASFNTYINDHLVLNGDTRSRYSHAYDDSIAWIGLKSTNAAVVSHALTVFQAPDINNTKHVTQLLQSWGKWTNITIHHYYNIFTTQLTQNIMKTRTNTDKTDKIDMNLIMMILFISSVFICCCLMIGLCLFRWLNKMKNAAALKVHSVDQIQINPQLAQVPGIAIEALPETPPAVDPFPDTADVESSKSQTYIQPSTSATDIKRETKSKTHLKAITSGEGIEIGIICVTCNTRMDKNAPVHIRKGSTYCNRCVIEYDDDDDDGDDVDELYATPKGKHVQEITTNTAKCKTIAKHEIIKYAEVDNDTGDEDLYANPKERNRHKTTDLNEDLFANPKEKNTQKTTDSNDDLCEKQTRKTTE